MKKIPLFLLTSLLSVLAVAAAPPQLVPQPHEVQWHEGAEVALTRNGQSRLRLQFHGTPDELQQRALDKFAARLRRTGALGEAPVFRPDGDVVLRCGIAPEVSVPGLPEKKFAYAIAITPEAITVSGRDADGLRYGLLILAQLLQQHQSEAVMPAGTLRDYPEIPYSSYPVWIGTPDEVLEFIADEGRINWCFSEFITVHDWEKHTTGEVDWQQYRDLVERLHRNGIRISATAGWLTHHIRATKKRVFCPVKDMPELLTLYQKAIDAGVDGLSMHFDDISIEEATHWRDCPECREAGFSSLGQAQNYCLQKIYELAAPQGIENFWACPTQYTRYRNFPATYSVPDPELTEEKYFAGFFDFPASEHYRFYYCDFGRGEFESVAEMGFKNFMWWNNGVWSGSFILIFNAGVTFPSFLQGWGFWELKDGVESFDCERFRNLAHLPEFTEYNYTGASGPLSVALGSTLSWNPKAYIADEEAVRRHFFELLFGPEGYTLAKAWEDTAKPLWLKQLRIEPFDIADMAALKRLPELHAALAAARQYPDDLYADMLTAMPPVIAALENYAQMFQELAPAAGIATPQRAFQRQGEWLTVVPASEALPEGAQEMTLAQRDQVPRLSRLNGRPAWVSARSCFTATVPGAEANNHSFSLVLAFTPTVMPGENCTLLGGTRDSYRAAYPGLPGWGLGMSTFAGELEFTVEDTEKNVSTLSQKNVLEANRFVTVVAVRDAEAGRLRLYIDGKPAAETEEKGNRNLGSADTIQSGYDNWGGAHFIGGIHYFSLRDRALTAEEVAELDRKLRQ